MPSGFVRLIKRLQTYTYMRYGALGFGAGLGVFAIIISALSELQDNNLVTIVSSITLIGCCTLAGAILGCAASDFPTIKRYALVGLISSCALLVVLALFLSGGFSASYLALTVFWMLPGVLGLFLGVALGAVQKKPSILKFGGMGFVGFLLPAWIGIWLMLSHINFIVAGFSVGIIGGGVLGLAIDLELETQKVMGYQS
jgi:hypothetical protein